MNYNGYLLLANNYVITVRIELQIYQRLRQIFLFIAYKRTLKPGFCPNIRSLARLEIAGLNNQCYKKSVDKIMLDVGENRCRL